MTSIDWLIILFVAALAVLGHRQGLVVGALSLAGFAGGAVLGARFGPELLSEGPSPLRPRDGVARRSPRSAASLPSRSRVARGPARGGFGRDSGRRRTEWAAPSCSPRARARARLGARCRRPAHLGRPRASLRHPALGDPPGAERAPAALGAGAEGSQPIDPTPTVRGPEARVPAPDAAIARDPDVERAGQSGVRVLGTAWGWGSRARDGSVRRSSS